MMEIEERFWAKVDWDLADTERCWPWTASKMHRGYGQFQIRQASGRQAVTRAHRLAYELEFGPIPEANDEGEPLHIDHACHDPEKCDAGEECPHRACCNPHHLRVVTNRANHHPERAARRPRAPRRPARTKAELAAFQADFRRRWWAGLTPERRAEIGAAIRKARWG
jgi:hypothetical protein